MSKLPPWDDGEYGNNVPRSTSCTNWDLEELACYYVLVLLSVFFFWPALQVKEAWTRIRKINGLSMHMEGVEG